MNFKYGDIIIINNKQIAEMHSIHKCEAYRGNNKACDYAKYNCTGRYIRATCLNEWCLVRGREIRKATDRETFLYYLGILEIESEL